MRSRLVTAHAKGAEGMDETEEVSSPKRRLMEAQAQDQQILQQVHMEGAAVCLRLSLY